MAEGKGRTHIVALAAAGVVAVGIVAGVLIASQRPEKRFEAAALETETRETETRRETETSAAETETAAITAATAPATPVTAAATAAPVEVTAAATVAADYSRTMYVSHCAQSISLRESPTTAARAVKQIPFAAPVTVLETADNGFYKVIYNGTTGYALASYLINYQPDESERLDKPVGAVETSGSPSPTYRTMFCVNCKEYITLRSVPDTKGADLAHIPLGASVSYVRTADNGFYEVIYNGKRGYALAQYLSY
ncbi:SH3 domain-containing protein [Stomatobaculum longum]|uniref:SH3 domain-containing protein n=1 Tax=Stomatobaculum longum TaxID=796942 RepID=UPI0028E60788|nr:SH3 domain-containing protein [Stomatobaculum longum]